MPNWNQVLGEIEKQNKQIPNALDQVRRKYLKQLNRHTDRNIIAYYSGWLAQPRPMQVMSVNDADKNGFMAAIHKLDRTKGLDLILHTPGGDLAAAESLVDYLHKMFGDDIRAVVPQLAMSAGTMIACAAKEIVMGKQSNLGPTDPQIGGVPASGVLAEFEKAMRQIEHNSSVAEAWRPIIEKYHPSFLGSCENAVTWSKQITADWLKRGMFKDQDDAAASAIRVVDGLTDPDATLNHSRHIHIEKLEELGLKIKRLEDDEKHQDLVLTVHHAFMHTFHSTGAVKIIENHAGAAHVLVADQKTVR